MNQRSGLSGRRFDLDATSCAMSFQSLQWSKIIFDVSAPGDQFASAILVVF